MYFSASAQSTLSETLKGSEIIETPSLECSKAATLRNIPEDSSSIVTQSTELSPPVEVNEIEVVEPIKTATLPNNELDAIKVTGTNSIENQGITKDLTEIRNDSTVLEKATSQVKEQSVDNLNKTQSDILSKTLELNTQLMTLLKSQKDQLEELMKTKNSCEKCIEASDILFLTGISAEQKICILQSLHMLSQQK